MKDIYFLFVGCPYAFFFPLTFFTFQLLTFLFSLLSIRMSLLYLDPSFLLSFWILIPPIPLSLSLLLLHLFPIPQLMYSWLPYGVLSSILLDFPITENSPRFLCKLSSHQSTQLQPTPNAADRLKYHYLINSRLVQ